MSATHPLGPKAQRLSLKAGPAPHRPCRLHFSDVETEAEGGEVTCSGHTAWKRWSWDVEPGSVGPPHAVGLSKGWGQVDPTDHFLTGKQMI